MKANTLIRKYLDRIAKHEYGKSYRRLGSKRAAKIRKIAVRKLRLKK